jgi:hypothetical protein
MLVQGVRILYQWCIKTAQLLAAHGLLLQFVKEYENLYYAQLPARLHFVCQSIHAIVHLTLETVYIGPGVYIQQWTLECTIGSLGQEIKQPSNPFANIVSYRLRRSQVNAIKVIIPDFNKTNAQSPSSPTNPQGDYVLLWPKDRNTYLLSGAYANAFHEFMCSMVQTLAEDWTPKIIQWARLHLPNQQVSRLLWGKCH